MGDHVYNSEMTAAERHAVYQIRDDLNANKDPLGKLSRKRTCSVMWRSSVLMLAITLATVLNMTTTVARANTLTKLTAAPTRISLDLFASPTLTRSRKALAIDMT